jgi:phosphate transport system permease protein
MDEEGGSGMGPEEFGETGLTAAAGFDPTAPLTPSGNLRRRQIFSRFTESAATLAAVFAVGVLGIVIYTVLVRGASAINLDFFIKGAPEGIGPAIAGTALIVAIATVIAMPIGVLIALYMSEFADGEIGRRIAGAIKLVLDLMNGLPSIIIGLFVFGLIIVPIHAQAAYAASVALAIIEVPLIARGSLEVLALVPNNLREAADALGVSRWRAVLTVILPSAAGGIVTSSVLAVARAAGETAPLIFTTSVYDPSTFSFNPTEALPNIPVTIFQLSEEANPESLTRAWGASLVLVAGILIASLSARALLARSKARMSR